MYNNQNNKILNINKQKMKIWLDLRFIADNIYSTFVIELVKELIQKDNENEYIIYTNNSIDGIEFSNSSLKNVSIKNWSIKEQTTYLNILKHDNNNLMIFFNHYKPVKYLWNYFTLLASLKDVYYSNFSNYIEKYSFLYLLEKNLKNSKKIICLDNNTIDELIEKYNIEESKITTLQWFFPNIHAHDKSCDLKLNIKTKFNIKNDFFIYSWWDWVEKNYEKLISVFSRLKNDWINIDLVFLWEAISRNVSLRNLVINQNMQDNIHFIWMIKPSEKILFYNESIAVIFPSLYEPFPFRLSEPLHFNSPIIASDLKNIKNIFWESIWYFSAISVNNIYENIKNYLKLDDKEKNKHIINYAKIKEIYNINNTINQLLEIMK